MRINSQQKESQHFSAFSPISSKKNNLLFEKLIFIARHDHHAASCAACYFLEST